jgi:dephospho-CoA kinase
MKSGKIQVLVGMIASGKSTYAKNAARRGVICVNDDAVVNLVHADDYTLYDKSLKILYKSIENHIISMALAMSRTVLVDRGLKRP